MKLWELRPTAGLETGKGPWYPLGDKVFGFIVRAEDAAAARMLAREKHGGEGGFVWLDAELTTCAELASDGDARVVMADCNAD